MKWYKVHFSVKDISIATDKKLIANFLNFLTIENTPLGLALHTSILDFEEDIIYYFSTPDEYAIKLKALLIEYRFTEISEPELSSLSTIIGDLD